MTEQNDQDSTPFDQEPDPDLNGIDDENLPTTEAGRALATLCAPSNEDERFLLSIVPARYWDLMAGVDPKFWDQSESYTPALSEVPKDTDQEAGDDEELVEGPRGRENCCIGCGVVLDSLSLFVNGRYDSEGSVDLGEYGVTVYPATWGRMCAGCYLLYQEAELGSRAAELYCKTAGGRWRLLLGLDEIS